MKSEELHSFDFHPPANQPTPKQLVEANDDNPLITDARGPIAANAAIGRRSQLHGHDWPPPLITRQDLEARP